jgi:hypothetical protein
MKTERRHPYHYTRVQHLQPEDYPARCPIIESMELILIGKIGKFSHEKCRSVFWTYVRRIVPLVIRRIISPSVYHGKIIFSREIRLSNVTLLLIPCEQQVLIELAINSGDFW